MEAKKRKFTEKKVRTECCTCGESGSSDVNEVSRIEIQNKPLSEIIKDVVNIKVSFMKLNENFTTH